MLNAARALSLNTEAGRKLPYVPAFKALYDKGFDPRFGQVIMVAGRSGSQKSGFAMFWADQMNLDTLYICADMSPFTASSRLASTRSGLNKDQVEAAMKEGGRDREEVLDSLAGSKITFAFTNPITWWGIEQELNAHVEAHNAFPQVILIDNLMDCEGAESDYSAQMAVMQGVTEIARITGATVIIMHHASDKSWSAKDDPWSPPARNEIKGGMSEKPDAILTVALNPMNLDFNAAMVKQRDGAQDPSARRWATLRCEPTVTRFHCKQNLALAT